MKKENFEIVICGVGGQGIITLLRIMTQAAACQGYEVRASELHGLSQRGGSVVAHLRFGKKVFSPLVSPAGADLIFGLETTEALRNAHFLNSQAVFLVNKKFIGFFQGPTEKQILSQLENLPVKPHFVDASRICQQALGKEVLAGTYLFCLASHKGLIPLKPESILKAMQIFLPLRQRAINKKAFILARESL